MENYQERIATAAVQVLEAYQQLKQAKLQPLRCDIIRERKALMGLPENEVNHFLNRITPDYLASAEYVVWSTENKLLMLLVKQKNDQLQQLGRLLGEEHKLEFTLNGKRKNNC